MKKITLSLLLLGSFNAFSQELTQQDALRYATTDLTGTARFSSMSGAFGAVGGDMSAININPAGSIIFNNNYGSITGTNFNTKNKSNYFGTATKDSHSTLDLNQIGGVLIFNDRSGKSDWNKIAVALNYENIKNFDNSIYSAGVNPSSSIGQYFVDYANFDDGTDFNYYQYEMGYDSYILNPDPNNATQFISNVASGGNYTQRNFISTAGYNGKFTANVATSYKDKLLIGMNLNAHFTDYVKTTSLYENNSNPDNEDPNNGNPLPTVRNIRFDNQVSTYGTGFSFNLGAIYKFSEAIRLGASYELPTWYRLNDELIQDLYTFDKTNVPADDVNSFASSPTFIFPTYKLQTPSKLTGSFAYIFGTKGLLSVDVASKDYSNISFRPKSEAVYNDLNNAMDLTLTNTLEIRLGGEYKYKQFSFRGGYRFEESPYKVDYAMGDLTGYSGGIGYNFGHNRLDFAYAYSHRNYNQYLISSGMNDTARIRAITNNFTVTYSINF